MSNAVLNAAQMATQAALNVLIDQIATSEKQTRADLKEFSRSVLPYVMDTDDIEVVNRLVGILTVNNAAKFIDYANHFLPWVSEKDEDKKHVRFGKMQASHIVVKAQKKQTEFLLVADNNFWTWAQAGATPKVKDFAELLKKLVEKSAKGDDNTAPLTHEQILAAVFSGSNFSIDDMLKAVEDQKTKAAPKVAVAEVQPMAEAA